MSSKRSIEFVAMVPAKRRLLDEFVRELGLDEGVDDGDGPYPFANLPRPAPVIPSPFPGPVPTASVHAPRPQPGPGSGTFSHESIDLDQLCNTAYEQMFGYATGHAPPGPAPAHIHAQPGSAPSPFPGPAPRSTTSIPGYAPGSATDARLTLYPRETMYKDFPLTRNASKLIRIGVDVQGFETYVMLMGDSNSKGNRPWLRITPEEFTFLMKSEVMDSITHAFKNCPI